MQESHSRFVEPVMTYDPIPDSGEVFLQVPFSIAFHENGDLYVLDSRTCKIHVWNKRGKYLRHFGKTGSGPGEMTQPAKIDIFKQHLWVFDHSGRRLTQFDLQGNVRKTLTPDIRAYNFAVLGDAGFLIGYKRHAKEGTRASFRLLDGQGKDFKTLVEIKHLGYLPKTADGKQTIKAFGPEMVIQKTPTNTWLFGFSQTTKLYEIDAKGTIIGEYSFDHQVDPPSESDIEFHKHMNFVNLDGRETSFEKMNRLTFSYEHDMAYYTHFTKTSGGEIIFATTPLGGFVRAAGFYRAHFVIGDWATQKPRSKGFYAFPEGSHIYFHNGRILAFELDDSGDFQIKSLRLKGR